MRTALRTLFTMSLVAAIVAGQPADFRKLMISEVCWGNPLGVEITNFSPAAIDLTNWRLVRAGVVNTLFMEISGTLNGMIQPGESILVTGTLSAPIPEAPPGTRILTVLPIGFQNAVATTAEVSYAVRDPLDQTVDEVRVSSTSGNSGLPSLGGDFRGLALRNFPGTVCVERIWGLDSNGGMDWTAEVVRSFGLENRSSGPRGSDPVGVPLILITEIDSDPDYLEMFNAGAAAVDLRDFQLLSSAGQGLSHNRILPFPSSLVLASGGYVVMGNDALVPSEKPPAVPYVNLAAIGGGTLPFGNGGFDCALYDQMGRLVDLVRFTDGGGGIMHNHPGVVHNHPRVPSFWDDFAGAAPLLASIGGGSTGRQLSGPNFIDNDRGGDWRPLFFRSMGFPQQYWVGNQGFSDVLDVRLNETGLGNGMTIIINAGTAGAFERYSFLFSLGHLNATGPFFGLGMDAINNWLMILTAPPYSGVLDVRGSARVDLPPNSLPPSLESDCIFILQDAAGLLSARTAILEYDT